MRTDIFILKVTTDHIIFFFMLANSKNRTNIVSQSNVCTLPVLLILTHNSIQMAGEKAVSTASKPQLRGLLNSAIKRNLIISLTLAAISGVAFKQLVGTRRKQRYAEFYRYQ